MIPGNDDAIRAGNLMCRIIADAVEEGRFINARRNGGRSTVPSTQDAVVDAVAEVKRSEQQNVARRQAAVAQAEREARLLAAKAGAAAAPEAEVAAPVAEAAAAAEAAVEA